MLTVTPYPIARSGEKDKYMLHSLITSPFLNVSPSKRTSAKYPAPRVSDLTAEIRSRALLTCVIDEWKKGKEKEKKMRLILQGDMCGGGERHRDCNTVRAATRTGARGPHRGLALSLC